MKNHIIFWLLIYILSKHYIFQFLLNREKTIDDKKFKCKILRNRNSSCENTFGQEYGIYKDDH